MTDIVERLRATGGKGQCGPLKAEAADEIERLRGSILEAIERARLPHYGYKHLQLGNYYDAISILEKALEGK